MTDATTKRKREQADQGQELCELAHISRCVAALRDDVQAYQEDPDGAKFKQCQIGARRLSKAASVLENIIQRNEPAKDERRMLVVVNTYHCRARFLRSLSVFVPYATHREFTNFVCDVFLKDLPIAAVGFDASAGTGLDLVERGVLKVEEAKLADMLQSILPDLASEEMLCDTDSGIDSGKLGVDCSRVDGTLIVYGYRP